MKLKKSFVVRRVVEQFVLITIEVDKDTASPPDLHQADAVAKAKAATVRGDLRWETVRESFNVHQKVEI
jgi:hypothetical protein